MYTREDKLGVTVDPLAIYDPEKNNSLHFRAHYLGRKHMNLLWPNEDIYDKFVVCVYSENKCAYFFQYCANYDPYTLII